MTEGGPGLVSLSSWPGVWRLSRSRQWRRLLPCTSVPGSPGGHRAPDLSSLGGVLYGVRVLSLPGNVLDPVDCILDPGPDLHVL